MFQEFLGTRGDLLVWPLIGLGIFVASFVIVVLYVSIGLKDRQQRDRLAALPLEDDALTGSAKDAKKSAAEMTDAKMGEAIR